MDFADSRFELHLKLLWHVKYVIHKQRNTYETITKVKVKDLTYHRVRTIFQNSLENLFKNWETKNIQAKQLYTPLYGLLT